MGDREPEGVAVSAAEDGAGACQGDGGDDTPKGKESNVATPLSARTSDFPLEVAGDVQTPCTTAMGIDWRYELADIADEADVRAFLAARDFASINITTPYKPLAFEYATAQAATAKLARGANLLVRAGDELVAYNTDGQGCVDYLKRAGFAFPGARVVVCGTGPTSLAILHACAVAGAADVTLVGRDRDRTHAALARYVETFGELAYSALDVSAAHDGGRTFKRAYEETSFRYGSYATSHDAIRNGRPHRERHARSA